MKIKNQLLTISTVALLFTSCNKKENATTSSNEEAKSSNVELKNAKDSLSYALGSNYANAVLQSENSMDLDESIDKEEVLKAYNETLEFLKGKSKSFKQGFIVALQRDMIEAQLDTTNILNNDVFVAGLKDGLNKVEKIDRSAGQMAFEKYLSPIQMKAEGKMQKRAEARKEVQKKENKEKGTKFIEAKKKEGYKVTESGLLYKVIKEGGANKPTDSDLAKVIYTGKLIDGKVFDTSNGEPRDLPVGNMVPGFKEALKMMGKGAKMEIILPAELGYGEMGNQGIEPNSTLIFEVELTDFGPAPKNEGQPMQLSPEQIQQMMSQQGK